MEKDKGLMEASQWEGLTEQGPGSCSDGGAVLSESLIQFSVDGGAVVPPCRSAWPNYGGHNEDKGNLLQKAPCIHCCTQCPSPAAGHR